MLIQAELNTYFKKVIHVQIVTICERVNKLDYIAVKKKLTMYLHA